MHLCGIDLHDVKDKKIQAVGNTKVKVIADVGATYLSKSTNAKYLLYDLMISHFVCKYEPGFKNVHLRFCKYRLKIGLKTTTRLMPL